MPFLYRLNSQHTLSITHLKHALQLILTKHLSLRTALVFDKQDNLLVQQIIDTTQQHFTFIQTIFESNEHLTDIMHNEKRNSQLFDLAQGLVFRCHILHYKHIPTTDLITDQDVIIFNFHHALFDFPSMDVFLHDLNQAYTTDQLSIDGDTTLRYLDCKYIHLYSFSLNSYSFISDAVIEHEMPMNGASMFWLDALHGCNLDRSLALPYDRYRLVNEHRTGRGTSISFDFGQRLSNQFLTYASSNNIALEHLALACYYVFLFKATNGERDLCVGMNTHGRYRQELMSVIGMFVNAIPLRYQLNPHLFFHQLVDQVQEVMTNSLQYSYFPLQRILAQHPNISKPTFLDTSFVYRSTATEYAKDAVMIGSSQLHPMPMSIKISEAEIMSKFDFALSIQHDAKIDQFSCTINASIDLFNVHTIDQIGQRFHSMLQQLFDSHYNQTIQPTYELSVIVSDERLLLQSMNNTQVSSPVSSCVHHQFVDQVMKHPQKLAVELDDQSLTYSELFHHAQSLALELINNHHVSRSEIICQCVERSLSMVSHLRQNILI